MSDFPSWPRRLPPRRSQSGAVLIVSLVMLVVLTLLGVTSMNTTQLEERMASNSQERIRAFQAAETGLSTAFNDNDAWDLNGASNPSTTIPGATGGIEAAWNSLFVGFAPPPPNSGFDTSFQAAHFNFQSTGKRTDIAGAGTGVDLDIIVNGGGYQIAPSPGS